MASMKLKGGATEKAFSPEEQQAKSTNSAIEQIKYLLYCVENAILNLNSNQEQMIWLVDFQGWSKSCISLKVTKETAQLLQNHYPERLGMAILYNPPKLFESFWTMVKPFLEPKTHRTVRFVYPENVKSHKIMEELFDMDKLVSRFGGKSSVGFNYEAYALRMREDDKKMSNYANSVCSSPTVLRIVMAESLQPESPVSENGCVDESSCDEAECSNVDFEISSLSQENLLFSTLDYNGYVTSQISFYLKFCSKLVFLCCNIAISRGFLL